MSVVVKRARPMKTRSIGSYSDAIDYALREGKHKDKERPLDVFAGNLASIETSREEMTALAREGSARRDSIYHVVVSWENGERPTGQEARDAAKIVAQNLGIERHQYVGSLQSDGKAGLYHLHIIFNRIDPVTLRAWSNYRDFEKLEAAGRAIEHEQGWKAATYGRNQHTAGLALGARDAQYYDVLRSFQTRVRDDLAPYVGAAIADGSLTWGRFHDELWNYAMRYVISEKGGRLEGTHAGEYAGVKKYLGISQRELVAALGEYAPDRGAGRPFEERARSAALEVRELYGKPLATWKDVHRAFDSRGLRYDRYGGGARVYDRTSPACSKASDIDSKLRLGPMRQRFGEFKAQLTAEERVEQRRTVEYAENIVVGERLITDPTAIIETLTEHESTFTRSQLQEEISKRVHDTTQRVLITEEIENKLIVLANESGARRFTTEAILASEHQLYVAARALATGEVALGVPTLIPSKTLNDQQREGYVRATSSRQLELITGVPGSGKTYLLDAVARAWQSSGYRVRAVSVANQAVKVIRNDTRISARTVAKEIYEWEQGRDRLTDRDVLIIDEVSMLDTKLGRNLLEEAQRAGAVVRAFGDDRQLQAVGRGDAMRAIHEEIERAGGSVYNMKKTQRQKLDWMRQATRDLREGRIREGLNAYHSRGFIQGYDNRHGAAQMLVDRWLRARDDRTDVGLSAFRRDDVSLLNLLARNAMRERGEIVGPDVTLKTAYGDRDFAIGDSVVVRQTVLRGKTASIKELRLELEQRGKTVYGASRSNTGCADLEAAGVRSKTVAALLRDRAWDRSEVAKAITKLREMEGNVSRALGIVRGVQHEPRDGWRSNATKRLPKFASLSKRVGNALAREFAPRITSGEKIQELKATRASIRAQIAQLRRPMFAKNAVLIIDNADRLDRPELQRLIRGARSHGAVVKLVVDERHVHETRFSLREMKFRMHEKSQRGDIIVSRKLTLDSGAMIKVPRGVETVALNRRWTNGDTGRVVNICGSTITIVRNSDGAKLEMDIARDSQLDHAYASTVHREQGSTHDVHLRLVTRADDARSTLVAMTRHRHEVHVAFAGDEFRHGYESLVQLAERTRIKEMATDFTVVGHGREVRGSEIAAPTLPRDRREPMIAREREALAAPAPPLEKTRGENPIQPLPERNPNMTNQQRERDEAEAHKLDASRDRDKTPAPVRDARVPESLRAGLERSGVTYDEYLDRMYRQGSQGSQGRGAMQVHDDTRSYHPVESDRDRLSRYEKRWNQDQTVTYSRNGREAFTDVGNRIVVHEHSKENIEASVQLAREKFGDRPIQINGSDEFKQKVLEECVRQGVRVGNPELQQAQKELQQQLARDQSGHTRDTKVREPSRDDLVRHASLKDWEQFYGKGREDLAHDSFNEAREDIGKRDVAYYQKIGYTRDQAEAQYHHARQSVDLPRDRQLEQHDFAYNERTANGTSTTQVADRASDARSAERTTDAFAKAKEKIIRDAGEKASVVGKVAMIKDRSDGKSFVVVQEKDRPNELTRVTVPTDQTRQLQVGDQVRAEPASQQQGHQIERERELQRTRDQERTR